MTAPQNPDVNVNIVRVNKYEIGQTLGEGTYGKVKKAFNVNTKEFVAIKILNKESILKHNMANQLKLEISLMKRLRHDNVVKLYEVLTSRSKIFIVLELCKGGELFEKIASATRFNEEVSRFYFRQLIRGVEYCHANGICHRDLKPENLLLDEKGVLKISDFGLCANLDKEDILLKTQCGTPNYTCPEILLGKKYDGKPADVWSCAVILFVMLAGFLPFEEDSTSELVNKIMRAEYSFPSFFPDGPKKLIQHILVVEPTKRLTIKQIKSTEWYNAGFTPAQRAEEQRDLPKSNVRISMKDVEGAFENLDEDRDIQTGNKGKGGPSPTTPSPITAPSSSSSANAESAQNTTFLCRTAPAHALARIKDELAKLTKTRGGNFYPIADADEDNDTAALSSPAGTYHGNAESANSNRLRVVFPLRGGIVSFTITVTSGGKSSEAIAEARRARGNQIEFLSLFKQLRVGLNDISPWAVQG